MGSPSQVSRLPETYRECLDFFFTRNQFAMKLGLENINLLLDKLGRPDKDMVFLHVAGTNGKGSVCANLSALLSASGFRRVGLYTSPHLVSFRERIRIDGETISCEFVLNWLRRAHGFILELNATYFECVTALALDYFRSMECETVVLETGLGGRLDATNAVTPALTIITSISLDHTAILGNTVAEIWNEKIGILKPHVPMVVMEESPELLEILAEQAKKMHSPVEVLSHYAWSMPANLTGDICFHGKYGTYAFPVGLRRERHQIQNLGLALLAMETFLGRALPISETLIPFLKEAPLPGRTQLLQETGRLPVLLDGAHNPGGMDALAAYLREAFPKQKIVTLFAVMRDKNFVEIFHRVRSISSEIYFVSLDSKYPRALTYTELTQALAPEDLISLHPFRIEPESISDLLLVRPDRVQPDLVVVCGSLYLIGEVIPKLIPHYHALDWFQQFMGDQVC